MISLLLISHAKRVLRIGTISVFLFPIGFLLFSGHCIFAQNINDAALPIGSSANEKTGIEKIDVFPLKAASEMRKENETCEIKALKTLTKRLSDGDITKAGGAAGYQKFDETNLSASPNSSKPESKTAFKNEDDDSDINKNAKTPRQGFDWRAAVEQSLLFLAVQHGYAFTQPKTRRELRGSFFGDYVKSVKSLGGWGDGGKIFTNYIAHPMQGSFTGFIQVHNDPKGKRQRFGSSSNYWSSRMKAMAWTAAWSTQFEIGPISQASIGNVGLKGKQTWVDLVMTPTLGTAMLVTEDALDRFLIERLEGNYYVMIFSRTLLNPTRTVANLIRFKIPWHRDRRRVR